MIRGTFNPATGRNWFAERGVDLRDRGIGDIKEKVILLPRNIRARCLPFTQVGFEGSDILLAIIDEPSRAVTSPPANLRAHKLFAKMLDNTTARYQRRGKVVLFSYPEAEDTDLIVELFDQAGTQFTTAGRRVRPTGNPDVYASMGATYEVNPRVRREDFDSQRRTDPEGVAARIDCRPPHSRTGFYRAWPAKVSASFCYDARNAILRYEVFPLVHQVQQAGQLVSRTYTGVKLLWVRGDDEPRALGGDPGERSDIFALALARSTPAPRSIEVVTQGRERVVSELPVGVPGMLLEPAVSGEVNRDRREDVRVIDRTVVVDGLVEIQPIPFQRIDPKTGRAVADTHPISFVSVRDFILELKQHFPNLHLAGFDRWQSSELVEELIRANIDARNLTFSNQEQFALYSQHRSLTYNDMVRAMPSARAEKEFLDLQEVIPGRKVDHKPEGSKDVSDAIVIAMGLALELAIAGGGDFILR